MAARKMIMSMLLILLSSSIFAGDFIKIDIPTEATINKIYFDGPGYGWAVTSDGEILSTYDGGKTWKFRDISKRNIRDIQVDGRTGYLTGERGLLMKSTDRGATWKKITMDLKYNFVGVGIVNDTSIIVCGTDQNSMSKTKGAIFQSFDYGKSWKKKKHLANGFTDLVVQPPRKIYLLASKKAFHSISGGAHFFPGKYSGSRLAWGFDLIDDWGFIAGYKGFFSRTLTHGRNWEDVDFGVTKHLYAVEMFDKYSGIVVGQDGIIITFSDSGNRFTVGQSGVDADLKTVCVTENKIFVGGADGTLLYKERFPKTKN